MIDLSGRNALIFGGTAEIAAGIAAELTAAGASVTLTNSLEQIADLAALDIAVIVPRWYTFDAFLDTTMADWDEALRQNFEQTVFAAQAAAQKMVTQGRGGRIIFLSSVAAMMAFSETTIVGTTLAMLTPIAKMAAVDLGPYGITVNVVALGWVEIEYYAPFLEHRPRIERDIPIGRILTLQEVGGVCCFLASDLARYITGAVLPVDGGYTLTRSQGTSPYPHLED